jgi:copper(I)-binding protein
MKKTMQMKSILTTLVIAAALAVATSAAFAEDFKAGAIVIAHPWARATPGNANVTAGYVKLTNTGTTPDRLVSATAEAASHTDIHEMAMAQGVMQMRPLKDGIVLKPGETVELAPGGNHLMLTGLTRPLKPGDRVKGTLVFEQAGSVDIVYEVQGIGGPAPAHTMPMPGGGMHMH